VPEACVDLIKSTQQRGQPQAGWICSARRSIQNPYGTRVIETVVDHLDQSGVDPDLVSRVRQRLRGVFALPRTETLAGLGDDIDRTTIKLTVELMSSQFRPPLTRDQLVDIQERNGDNVDVFALLWKITRLRAIVLRTDQLHRSLGTVDGGT
jgi:hypothetical protein